MNIELERNELHDKILYYNQVYRLGKPEISDAEYDALLDQYSYITRDTPELYTKLREKLFEAAGKIVHPFIMGSLEKIKAEEDNSVKNWISKHPANEYLVMAKIDGISCRLKYSYGNLVEAATRGDGEYGEDILNKVKLIKNIPVYINALKNTKECNIRGELVITKQDFNLLNEATEGKFKNSRNATAGIINRKHDVEYIKYVSFFAYEIMGSSTERRLNQLRTLRTYTFDVVEYSVFNETTINNIELLEYYNSIVSVENYDVDGLVLCAVDYYGENIKIPDNMVAFKANMLKAVSTVVDVDWGTPSKDGKLIPVIEIVPVELGGSYIQRVTAYNAEWIKTSKLKYGSDVVIMKSGDIIPKIVDIIETAPTLNKLLVDIEFPEVCPICDHPIEMKGVDCICPNPHCIGRTSEQAFLFVKKLGIKNVAKKTLENIGLTSIDKLLDSSNWTNNNPSIVKFYGTLKNKIYTYPVGKLLSCCNFTGISDTIFNKIWEVIENDIPECPVDSSEYVPIIYNKLIENLPRGVGETTVDSFIANLHTNMCMIWPIITSEYYNPSVGNKSNTVIIGSVCFTGSLNTMSRSEASELAEKAGYKVLGGVTQKLTYLVTNDVYSNSSKNKKAKEYNITIINEQQFLELVKNKDVTVESSIDLL